MSLHDKNNAIMP